MKNKKLKLMTINIIILFIFSMYIANLENPFKTNFSDLVNNSDYRSIVITWCIYASFTFGYNLYQIKYKLKNWMINGVVLALFVGLMFPYDPSSKILLSQLHVIFAYIGFLSTNAVMIYELIFFNFKDTSNKFSLLNLYILLMTILGFYFMIMGGVNSIFEVSFTIAMNTILILMYRRGNYGYNNNGSNQSISQ